MPNLKIERLHVIVEQHTSIVHVCISVTAALVERHWSGNYYSHYFKNICLYGFLDWKYLLHTIILPFHFVYQLSTMPFMLL